MLNNEEKDNIVTVSSTPEEQSMYKGKLYAGIEKEYVVDTSVHINLAKATTKGIIVQESTNQNGTLLYTRTV